MSLTRAIGDAARDPEVDLGPSEDISESQTSELGGMLHPQDQQHLQDIKAQKLDFSGCNQQQSTSRARVFEFKPFTKESMRRIKRLNEEKAKLISSVDYNDRSKQINNNNNNKLSNNLPTITCIEDEPDPYLASGQQLPPVLARQFPPELVGRPVEDIDPYYANRGTFVIISGCSELTRLSATKALYLFGPFHPIRRIVLCILVNPIFNILVMLTIVTNCILMTLKGSDSEEKTEYIFTIIYTTEMGLKVFARGFILDEFTYLRDPWNWLDFAVIIMAYLTIVVKDLGNLSVMRTFRVLRALKTVAIIPGMKTIVGAVIDSVKNLKDVVVLTLFSLSVFSLSGLQIYMGQLTQKCILDGPSNMTNQEWFEWASNSSHWVPEPNSEIYNSYRLCGNATGAQSCPDNHTCLQGFGPNPDYGFTNFDTFGWSLICSFRLMTQDYWEGLYMQILKTAGSWHIIYFIISIFLGSIYLMNLILAIVAMSYNELQRRAEEEEEAAAEEEAAFLESCRQMEEDDQYYFDNNNHISFDGRKSSALMTRPFNNDDQYKKNSGNSAFRPSIEIDLVDQHAILATGVASTESNVDDSAMNKQLTSANDDKQVKLDSQVIADEREHLSSKQYLRPDGRNFFMQGDDILGQPNCSFRSHSLTDGETGFKHESSISRQLANSGDINRAEAVHPNLVASMSELRHNSGPTTKICSQNGEVLQNMLDNAVNFNYNHDTNRLSKGNSIRVKRGGKKYALFRLKTQNADSDSKLLELKRRAASIRIVSDDYSEQQVQRSNQLGNDYDDLAQDHVDIGKLSVVKQQSTRNPHTSRSQTLNYQHQLSTDTTGLHNKFCSDGVICEQPRSINCPSGYKTGGLDLLHFNGVTHLNSPIHHANHTNLGTNNSGEVATGGDTPSNKSSESESSSAGGDSKMADSKLAISMQEGKRLVENMPITQIMDRRAGSGQNMQLLGGNSIRSPHHLSVENFYKYPAYTVTASNEPNLTSTSPTRDTAVVSPIRTRHIHPNVMARSSFAWPRSSLMPDSLPANQIALLSVGHHITSPSDGTNDNQVSGNSQPNNKVISVRRLSQEQYMRRASNWSRLSMSGNTDMRRLLRLWAHTNPYHMNQNGNHNQRINNYPSRFSPANSIVSQNLNLQYNHQHHSHGQSPTYSSNNQNSPRPSSVGSIRQAYELISALSRRRSHYGFDQRYGLVVDDQNTLGYDQVSVNFKDKCLATCLSCLDALCIWECCDLWLKIQRLISLIVFDPFTELFIILCILINTLFMALDSDDAGEDVKSFLDRGNYFFTATFAVEASMKIMALSPKFYFREGWNVFDAIIVGLSLLELGLEGVYGLSVLRSFRLLRVFKLAKSWPTLNLLISIMGKAIGDLGNLTFVLAIIVFIFAVMGMQLFGNKILCAEWIEPMWDCLLVAGWPCIPFFLIAVTVGNLVVLNLFLALLLASFGASNLSSPQSDNVDTKKLNEAIARFRRFGRWSHRMLCRSILSSFRFIGHSLGFQVSRGDKSGSGGQSVAPQSSGGTEGKKSAIVAMSKLERKKNIEIRTQLLRNKIRNNCESPETRKHRNLSHLAKTQARKCCHQNDNNNYNYNSYDDESCQNISMHDRQYSHETTDNVNSSQINRTSPSPMSNIHGIANRQSETQATTGYLSVRDKRRLSMRPSRIPIIIDEPFELGDVNDMLHNENGQSTAPVASRSGVPNKPVDCTAIERDNHPVTSNKTINIPQENISREILHPIREADSSANSEAESISLSLICSDREDDCVSEDQLKETGKESGETDDLKNRNSLARIMSSSGKHHHYKQKHVNIHRSKGERETPKASKYMLNPNQQSNQQQQQQLSQSQIIKIPDMEEEDERTLLYVESYIERCICLGIICLKFFLFRRFVRKIVEHKYFDQAILALIVISSGTLALEDKHLNDRPLLKQTLDALDTIFTIVFSLEMVLKWLAFGIKRYFSNIWSWLDFFIVLVSFINLMASMFGRGKIQTFKTMRTLRAMRGLRPLRALQRFQGMRVVVNALIQAIPSIFNVLLVCLIFWLIFSIMGVQMFGGKFWRCLDPITGELVSDRIVDNKQQCLERNLTWSNPQINFDNVLNAYLALFQVAIFKGWIEIMNSATDSRARDDQPIREANIYMYFYFVFFVIFGSFFTLNLFIGVIIDNFNEQKKKTGGSLEIFMTDDQKKYYHAMKKMKSKRPVKAMTRPKFKLQALLFDIATSRKFDMTIMIIIGINMFVMALEHYGQSQEFSIILENLNLLFIAIFTLECLCKIFAMRHFYFREPWNIFDFIVVCLSILGVVMKEYVAKYFVSPTLLRVVRVVKVGRILRLVKGAKGIRTLLFALAMSLPALFNICLLLFLVMFIYAIFGMSFFMNVRKRAGLDETFNFETFTSSIIVLFEMSTSAGWEVVLDPLMDEENDCQKPDPQWGIEGTCGNRTIAILYLMSYVIVTFLIIINMYIAVILENYSQATEDVQEGLTDDDYEMYYEIWQKFDPNGTQYLTLDKLSDFLDALEDPLRIGKPNDLAIVVLDINIYEGNRCYCVDILDALTKNFFARKGLNIQVNEHLEKVQSSIMHETRFQKITTTYMLKREHYCARLIQNSWRKWRESILLKNQQRKND